MLTGFPILRPRQSGCFNLLCRTLCWTIRPAISVVADSRHFPPLRAPARALASPALAQMAGRATFWHPTLPEKGCSTPPASRGGFCCGIVQTDTANGTSLHQRCLLCLSAHRGAGGGQRDPFQGKRCCSHTQRVELYALMIFQRRELGRRWRLPSHTRTDAQGKNGRRQQHLSFQVRLL